MCLASLEPSAPPLGAAPEDAGPTSAPRLSQDAFAISGVYAVNTGDTSSGAVGLAPDAGRASCATPEDACALATPISLDADRPDAGHARPTTLVDLTIDSIPPDSTMERTPYPPLLLCTLTKSTSIPGPLWSALASRCLSSVPAATAPRAVCKLTEPG
jgi:hypothetical protein